MQKSSLVFMRLHKRPIILLLLLAASTISLSAQKRLVLGGKAVIMVADAVYLFHDVGSRVLAVAGADQGLGTFLASIDRTFLAKPVIDRNAGVEVYASLKPDTVILKRSMKKNLGPGLDLLGLGQFYLDLETPEDYYRDILELGKFLGQENRSREIAEYYRKSVEYFSSLAGAGVSPNVLLLQASGSGQSAWEVPPAAWMQTRLVELAGGRPVWKNSNPGSGWATVNAEQIIAWNPDVVFVVDYRKNAQEAASKFTTNKALSSVKAVSQGAVYGFAQDFYSWDQPDTRWILGLEWISRRLHPEQFKSTTMEDSTRKFFSFMYGIDAPTFDAILLPRLTNLP
jgi:iron complex transport system substrate-binding protein